MFFRGSNMRRWIGCGISVAILAMVSGLLVVWIVSSRLDQERLACQNNLRQLSLFAEWNLKPPENPPAFLPPAIPAGTVPNEMHPPDRRLSWVVSMLPLFDSRNQPVERLLGELDRSLPWDAEANQKPAATRLPVLICPGNIPPESSGPAVTQYVGCAGLNPDGARKKVADPGAGCFRYDSATPFDAIRDVRSNTLLFCEISVNLGPWIAGGSPTLRGVDAAPPPAIGVGAQFGGNHPGGAYFGFADGSARFLSERIGIDVFREMATISGNPDGGIVGE